MLSDGSFIIFFSRPIAAVFLCVAIVLLVLPILPRLRKHRPAVGIEMQDWTLHRNLEGLPGRN